MQWQIYKLIFKAKSPLNLGYYKLGYVQRSRYYITGRNIWGAFTAQLTRSIAKDGQNFKPAYYETIGKQLMNQKIKVTYFFPAIDQDKPLFPSYTDQGLTYGVHAKSQYEFERQFIKSFGQTALEPSNLTAEEGSLHETEYIVHEFEDEKGDIKPVLWVGYICLHLDDNRVLINPVNNLKLGWEDGDIKIKEVLEQIYVGGERSYGFGRLELVESNLSQHSLFDYKLEYEKDKVSLKVPKTKPILAHYPISHPTKIKGDIEPLVGREWAHSGPGQKISSAQLCWVPGSIVDEETTFSIADYGLWSAS